MRLLLFYFTLAIAAPTSAQTFNGIGDIRLSIDEVALREIVSNEFKSKITTVTKKNFDKVQSEWTSFIISDKPPKAYKLDRYDGIFNWPVGSYNTIARYLSESGDSISVYYIPQMPLGGITVKDIYLTFRSGTLCLIELDHNSDLIKAAKMKYPITTDYDTSYKITCTYVNSGVKKDEYEMKGIQIWDYSDSFCEARHSYEFTPECKLSVSSSMMFQTKRFNEYLTEKRIQDKKNKLKAEDDKIKSVKEKI